MVETAILARRFPEAKVVVSGGTGELLLDGEGDADTAPRLLTALGSHGRPADPREQVPQHLRECRLHQAIGDAEARRDLAAGDLGLPHAAPDGRCSTRLASRPFPGRSTTAPQARRASACSATTLRIRCRPRRLQCANGSGSSPTGCPVESISRSRRRRRLTDYRLSGRREELAAHQHRKQQQRRQHEHDRADEPAEIADREEHAAQAGIEMLAGEHVHARRTPDRCFA